MNRQEFRETFWLEYPVAETKIVDCSAAIEVRFASEPLAVGGRLGVQNQNWTLSSGGATILLQFSKSVSWIKSSLKKSTGFESEILRAGDLLLVKGNVKNENGVQTFLADEVALLVPTEESSFQFQFDFARAKKWQSFVQLVRNFFEKRDFVEARTPTLVTSPGTEPFLDAFSTEMQFGARIEKVFLPTSPEFHLKKLLVAGFTKIFEFKECFRNKEAGAHHQPEFLMLEWYRAYSNLDAIADDAELLLKDVSKLLRGESCNLKRTTIAALFSDVLSFELTPLTSKEELVEVAKKNSVQVDPSESWDDIYFRIFLEKIEPTLADGGPYLLKNYPPSQSALARINQDGWADRFEIYWGGLEIANAFHELNDPQANIARFSKDAEDARRFGKTPVPHDQELVEALKTGMPPSGGIALGMDRLFMAALKMTEIAETRAFPIQG